MFGLSGRYVPETDRNHALPCENAAQ